MFQAGTERAGTGKTTNGYPHNNKEKGMYVSAVGDLPLFPSKTKYDSGTGEWVPRGDACKRPLHYDGGSSPGPQQPLGGAQQAARSPCITYSYHDSPCYHVGWPSFYAPVDPDHVIERRDTSIPFMPRTEVLCARSGAHLGHVSVCGSGDTWWRGG